MSQFALMHLSGTNVLLVISIFTILQVLLFVTTGLVQAPTFEDNVPATRCMDRMGSEWLYPRGNGNCDTADGLVNEVVFAFQLPLATKDNMFMYTRWQQYMLGMLQVDTTCETNTVLTIDARLAYRDHGDPDGDWKLYASSVEERALDCNQKGSQNIPLFALGSLYHSYYLLNIRLPKHRVGDLRLLVVNQESEFTKLMISVRTFIFSYVINAVVIFWNTKRKVFRPLTFLEYMLLILAAALLFLNMPLEYLTLVLNIQFMLVLNGIRLNIFYAAFLSFWLVFTGELLKLEDSTSSQSTFRCYWKRLTAVAIGCLSLIIFDMCEQSIRVQNPFSYIETNLVMTTLAGISACIYFLFLCYMIWKVFCSLNIKTLPPHMPVTDLVIKKRFFYKLKVLMLAIVLCVALTIIEFIVGRGSERYWGWTRDLKLAHTSPFYMEVYTMWNMFISAVIIFCIPIPLRAVQTGVTSTNETDFATISENTNSDVT